MDGRDVEGGGAKFSIADAESPVDTGPVVVGSEVMDESSVSSSGAEGDGYGLGVMKTPDPFVST